MYAFANKHPTAVHASTTTESKSNLKLKIVPKQNGLFYCIMYKQLYIVQNTMVM